MAEKTSQTNSSSNNFPRVPAVAPTSDTPYIQPIIGKLGYDTKHPDIFGIGASPDNGVSFRVFASFNGLVFNDNDIDAIWDNGTSEKVKSEVNSATAEIPAIESKANESLKKAESAIASSKVNSDALVSQSNAISKAQSAITQAQTAINQNKNAIALKADSSTVTQLSNLVQSKVSSDSFNSSITQLNNAINARVTKDNLISQINLSAGKTLIQSNKIYLDDSSVVFGKNSTAFIPNAAIQNLSLDKLTTGNLAIPLQDSTGNSVVLNSKGVTISSPVASTRAYGFKNMQVTIGSGQMHLEGDLRNVHTGVTSHYQLGELLPVYDSLTKLGNAVDEKDDQTVGTAFMVDTLNSGKNGNFFALARSRENNSNPPYVTGVVYNTTGEHREVGLHTFDPLYIHPYGADGYIQSTWVSWSNWNNGEKIPALTQAGSGWGGIGFPKSGQVSLFDDYGHVYQPQGGSGYTDYQHQYHL